MKVKNLVDILAPNTEVFIVDTLSNELCHWSNSVLGHSSEYDDLCILEVIPQDDAVIVEIDY